MTYEGWLLDLYADGPRGVALWLVTDDDRRVRLCQRFPVRFFAAGPGPRLRALWRWLREREPAPGLAREERRDLFLAERLPVLAVETADPAGLQPLFAEVEREFPDLTYYDADVPLTVRHAAAFGSFPLARCRAEADEQGNVRAFEVLESPWALDPAPPPLRILEINLPEGDPQRCPPTRLELRFRAWKQSYPWVAGSAPAAWLRAALQKLDPDIVLTDYGDTWLLPELLRRGQAPLSRDPAYPLRTVEEHTYFSYGQIVYRGQQVHLYGRVHIDRQNAMLWRDYGLEGILENARVTALPIQAAARISPGTGISCMQMQTALRDGVLVPWHKQQVEQPRSMLSLIQSDFGGLVYQPRMGLHFEVGAIDFVSLYPAVMVRCNISPETQARPLSQPPAPNPGLIPRTLAPLLHKRVALKTWAAKLPAWDPRRKSIRARTAAQKWLLVVCFGYLGYKNARFGRIEAHEAVTAGGREALLRAKEAAEDLGFAVLHLYVDGLWVQQAGCRTAEDFEPLLAEVTRRTGLPIALDGVYRWVAFLPSRGNRRVPVGNRYFGVFTDGSLKVRGLDARRRDTPPWVTAVQMGLLECLAQAVSPEDLKPAAAEALGRLRRELARLREGKVPLEELLCAQKLSRPLEKYTHPSPAARAAGQLQAAGKRTAAGQRVRFLYVRGEERVWAWDLPQDFDRRCLDVGMYRKLALRAAADVFQPFGIEPEELYALMHNAARVPLFPLPV